MGQTTYYTFNGGGTTGDWNSASTWTTDPTGSTALNQRVPASGDNVVVTNSYVVTVASAVPATGLNLTIQRGGVLDLTSAAATISSLSSLSGQGTLRIGAPQFPTFATGGANNFDDPNTGTVEFYNWPAGPTVLPQPATGFYNNLRLLNSTSTAYTVQLDNTLTLNGNLTLTRTNTNGGVTFNFGRTTNTARTLNVLGDLTVGTGTTLGVSGVNLAVANGVQPAHALNVAGSFVNNGTVRLHNGATTGNDAQSALLTFTGGNNANFACNGPTYLGRMQVSKGTDSQVLLNITATVAPGGASASNLTLNYIGNGRLLILDKGVAKFGNNIYLSKIHNGSAEADPASNSASGWYELGSSSTSPTLWVAGATILNDNASAFIVYGAFRISAGRFSSMTPDAMVVREDGQILIDGGTASVNKLRPSSTAPYHRGSFVMTGGTFESLGTIPRPSGNNDGYARFAVPFLSQYFRMSGGTLRVQNPSPEGLFHVGVDPNNAIISGGNVELIIPNSTVAANILTSAPLWNLTIKRAGTTSTSTSKAVLASITPPASSVNATTAAQPLTVLNNFTLDATNSPTFDANSKDVNIQGTFTLGTGSTYLTGTNTTTFSGGQDQTLVNNGTIGTTSGQSRFSNWTINKSAGTLTLGGSVTTYTMPAGTTLALLKGVLNDNDKTINVLGSIYNSASHTSGGVGNGGITMAGAALQTIDGDDNGVFGNLNINNGTTPVAVQLTANISVANTLTFFKDGVFAIGTNRLSITNVSTTAVQTFSNTGFSNKCMIQTAGNQSDLGLQKTFAANNSNFLFPVGVGTRYMPATIQLSLADVNFKYGQVSVSPTGSRNPFAGSNSLPYYWKVRSVGFGPIPANSVTLSFTMTNADITPAGSYSSYIPARYTPTAWATSVSNRIQGVSTNPTANIQFQNAGQFEGEYTAGQSTAFSTIVSYYSAVSGDWETPGTWRTGSPTGPAATVKPAANNPVFIGSNHTITVRAGSATSGSLVLDAGTTLDLGVTTGHNFGALPDSKVGGSGTLRITATPTRVGTTSTYTATPVFPGGDFGSFIQAGGGTVEYYGIANSASTTSAYTMTVPTTSSTSLTLNSYENLTLNPYPNSTLALPNLNLRVYTNLLVGNTNAYTGTASLSGTASGNLQVGALSVQNGKLRFANGVARTLAVDTDVQVGTNGSFDTSGPGALVANTVTVGGSIVNNGTLDFNTSGPKTAALTFTGAANTALTSAGATTDLFSLTVNKGTGRAAQLRLDGTGSLSTPPNSWLTLTNGTLYYAKPGATLTIHDALATPTPYLITDNAGLTVDAPNGIVTIATNNAAAADLKLAGQLLVTQGTLRVGNTTNTAGNDIEYASAGAPGIKVTGGNLYVNGQVRRPVTNLDGALRFDQSGGIIDIDGQGATAAQSNERGLLEVQGKSSIFRMSGGSLNLHRSNQKNPILTADLYLAPDSTVVIGGTVVLGNTTSINSNVTISVNSTVPLYDLQVAPGTSGSTNTGQLTGVIPLTLKGSLTIGNNFSFFNANGLGLNINQNLVNNNPSTSTTLTVGGFQPGTTTQTTTFVGGVPTQQLIGTGANLTTFGSVVLNTPQPNGTLQLLNGNALVAGTLTLTKGTLDDNDRTITALGDVLNAAVHTSGGNGNGKLILGGTTNQNVGGNDKGVFGNVTLNNAAGATATANQQITKVLNLSSGIFTIGSNLLWLSNPAAGAITNYGDTRFIRTNGIVADLGLRKSYPSGALDFTFPVGAAAKYTPVRMNVTTNPTAGTLTVQPIDLAHPSTTGSGTNKISFYWKVSSTLGSPTVDQYFTYGLNDIAGTESTYKLGRFYNGAWTPLGGIPGSAVTGTRTLTKMGYNDAVNNTIDGDYTGGDADEFKDVPTYYSRNATAGQPSGAVWTSASAWTFNADGSDSPVLPTSAPTLANPVVIASGHLITSNGPGLGSANLLLNGTLNLGSFGANNFNTVRGTGTVRIGSALFPAGNYAAFMTPAIGGTVDYTAAVQLPARDTYNNLTFSGGNSKQLSNLDLTINGSLTLAAGTTVDNPTSQSLTLTSATSGATLNGTFNLNDGNLTTSAFLTNGGTLNLGAGLASIGTTFTNTSTGTLNNGTGDVVVGTAFSNAGTYNANVGTGNLTVGTTFANSNTYNAGAGQLTVNGDFNNDATGAFTTASGSTTVNGSFLNAGSYQQGAPNVLRIAGNFTNTTSGSFSNDASTLALYGNFTNSAGLGFDPGQSGLVQFITDANRILTGSTSFYDVQKVSTGNLLFSPGTTMTVGNVLTLRGGLLVTGVSTGNGTNTDASNTLTLTNKGVQPIVGASTTSYVAGRMLMALPDAATVSRVFPVGLGGRYRPVLVTPQATSSNARVLVEIFNSAPASNLEASLSNISANRYYRIQLQSGTLNQPTVQLNFNTDAVDEEVHVPGNLRVATATSQAGRWSSAGGAGVFSPADPRGYTNSAATTIDATSFFALASTNKVDNPLTGSAPLPVQLLSFAATRQGTTVRTAWATASEKNSAYFLVQRSANGRTFSNVQQVAAQGNTLVRHDYVAVDANPLPGTSYYRLRQVDLDGTVAYSPVATVRFSDEQAAPTLAVYPNPTAGQRFQVLATGLTATGGTVQLFDNVGRLVLTQTAPVGAAEATIQPTRPLASGMYLVTWQTADGRKLTTKLAVD
jgi:fibronectin-binding autotransporter adhesin